MRARAIAAAVFLATPAASADTIVDCSFPRPVAGRSWDRVPSYIPDIAAFDVNELGEFIQRGRGFQRLGESMLPGRGFQLPPFRVQNDRIVLEDRGGIRVSMSINTRPRNRTEPGVDPWQDADATLGYRGEEMLEGSCTYQGPPNWRLLFR
jgi:hypothetical protein